MCNSAMFIWKVYPNKFEYLIRGSLSIGKNLSANYNKQVPCFASHLIQLDICHQYKILLILKTLHVTDHSTKLVFEGVRIAFCVWRVGGRWEKNVI